MMVRWTLESARPIMQHKFYSDEGSRHLDFRVKAPPGCHHRQFLSLGMRMRMGMGMCVCVFIASVTQQPPASTTFVSAFTRDYKPASYAALSSSNSTSASPTFCLYIATAFISLYMMRVFLPPVRLDLYKSFTILFILQSPAQGETAPPLMHVNI